MKAAVPETENKIKNATKAKVPVAKYVNIAALRIFRLFQWLHQASHKPDKGLTLEKINQRFMQDPYTRRALSDDTIGLYFNTLRQLGCRISRPTNATGGRYCLLSHPFRPLVSMGGLGPSSAELGNTATESTLEGYLNALASWKTAMAEELSPETLLAAERVLSRVMQEGEQTEVKARVAPSGLPPLAKRWFKLCRAIDYAPYEAMIGTLQHAIQADALVFVHYQSPRHGSEHLYLLPRGFTYSKGALYLQAYRLGATLGDQARLRVDRMTHCQQVNHPQVEAMIQAEIQKQPVATVILSPLVHQTGGSVAEETSGMLMDKAESIAPAWPGAWLAQALQYRHHVQPVSSGVLFSPTFSEAFIPDSLMTTQVWSTPLADGRCVCHFRMADTFATVQVLLQSPVPLQVVAPVALQQEYARELAAMLALYNPQASIADKEIDKVGKTAVFSMGGG